MPVSKRAIADELTNRGFEVNGRSKAALADALLLAGEPPQTMTGTGLMEATAAVVPVEPGPTGPARDLTQQESRTPAQPDAAAG